MEKYKDLLDKIGEMKVVELAEFVKAMEEKFGISAAMPVMAAGAGAAGAEAEEKTAWNVLLKDGGSQKIQVIKAIREVTGRSAVRQSGGGQGARPQGRRAVRQAAV